mmetsp:Transcript_10614/g.29398  ORF Transcript_10614/g.29398 Transcript_10614/m.29398 type:complete len:336 (-) Transcript_10614:146-1153(-)
MASYGLDTTFGRPQSDKYISSAPMHSGSFGSGSPPADRVVHVSAPEVYMGSPSITRAPEPYGSMQTISHIAIEPERVGHVSAPEVYMGSPSITRAPEPYGSTRTVSHFDATYATEPARVVTVASRDHEPVVVNVPKDDSTGLVEGSLSVVNGVANRTSNAIRDVGGNIVVKPLSGTLNIWAELVVDGFNCTRKYVAKPIIGTVDSTLAVGRDYVAEPMGMATAETVFFGWDKILKPCGELILKPCSGLGCCGTRIEYVEVPTPTYEVRRPVTSEVISGHYIMPSSSHTLNHAVPPSVGSVRDAHVYRTREFVPAASHLGSAVVEGSGGQYRSSTW